MRFLTLFISYVIFVLPFFGKAQSVKPSDTLKVHTERLIDEAKNVVVPQKRYEIALQTVKYSNQVGDSHLLGKAFLGLGQALLQMNKYSESISNAKKAIDIFTEYNDSSNLAKTFNLLGTCHMRRAQYEKAIDYFSQTMLISSKLNDSISLALSFNNLGIVYYSLKRYSDAKEYFAKSYSINRLIGQIKNAAKNESNIGLIYLEEEKYEEANQHFNTSLKLRLELKDTSMLASIYDNLGNAQEKLGNFKQSLQFYTLSNQYFRIINSRHGIALSDIALARAQIKLGKHNDAHKNLNEGLSIATKDQETDLIMQCYNQLSEYYLKTGNTLLSREMLEKYIDMLESSYNEKVTNRIAELQVQLDTVQKEHDYKFLEAKLEMQQLQSKQSNRLKTIYSILAILLFILLGITLKFTVQVRRKNREIKRFNQQLFKFNNELEKMVKDRTQDLSEALEKVKELEKIKSAFLSNISHEIRTPLNGIIGFTQYLVSPDVSSEDKQQCGKLVQKLSAKLLRIVEDILELSKIETNQIDLHFSDTNINNLLGDLYQTFSNNEDFLAKNLHFKLIKSLPDNQAIFSIDALRVKNIMSNLVENAFKFTNVGSIEFGYYNDSPSMLKFFVKDTGIGIPSKIQQRVFERFFKHITEDHAMMYEGTGIGLTIAKGYAFSMGGRIEMESSPGHGSTFYFYLPKNQVIQNTENANNDEPPLQWNNKTILIVEDDLICYQYIDTLLQRTGTRLIHVKNAEDAIEVCTIDKSLNLIIMDIQLPFMDGIEATKAIRNINPKVPIIAQSANSVSDNGADYINAGCNAFIAKPIDPDDLFNQINKFIV
ncbi:MAG: tetratricopeptide repeat protein [Bacteroidales bacterium]